MRITRKGFFATLAALLVRPAMAKRRLVDVSDANTGEGFIIPTRVLLDGRDVSDICFRVEKYSDGTGKAWLYRQDSRGQFILLPSRDEVATETRAGRIEIIRPS